MRIDVRKATLDDARAVAANMTERHKAETAALSNLEGDELVEALAERFENGVCATAGGRPVAVGEVFTARPNVASLGLLTTDDFPYAALRFTKFLRDGLFVALRAQGVHRIECVTMADFDAARRWLRTLGLEEEAKLRRYGRDGEDFVQFAWVA